MPEVNWAMTSVSGWCRGDFQTRATPMAKAVTIRMTSSSGRVRRKVRNSEAFRSEVGDDLGVGLVPGRFPNPSDAHGQGGYNQDDQQQRSGAEEGKKL